MTEPYSTMDVLLIEDITRVPNSRRGGNVWCPPCVQGKARPRIEGSNLLFNMQVAC